jgi:CheY-like chemotaxis protein
MPDRRPHILYVDDDDDLRIGVEAALVHGGFDVTAVGDAEAGIAALRDGRYDLLLTDEWMPGETGTEMIERARGLGVLRQTRTCVVTSDEDLLGSRSDLHAKPVGAAALVRCVGDMLAAAPPPDAGVHAPDARVATRDARVATRGPRVRRPMLDARSVLAAVGLAVGLAFAHFATVSASQRPRAPVDALKAAGT